MFWKSISSLLLATSLAGCGRLLSSYDVTPDGLIRGEHEIRRHLSAGHADSALLYLDNPKKQNGLPNDELLRLLFEGVAAHQAGEYGRSAAVFDRAALIAEDRSTKSLSKAALSMMVNDLSLAWEPAPTERLLLPYYAASSYANAGDYGAAAVEARRLSHQLALAESADNEPPAQLRAFLRYFAGVIFSAAGETADADVAFRNARALDSLAYAADSANVVILVERGFAPHRVPESLTVLLADHETHYFDEHRSHEDRHRLSGQIAERVLAFANTAGPRSAPPRGRTLFVPAPEADRRKCDSTCEKHDDHSYLLRLSWPVMYEPPAPRALQLRIDSSAVDAAVRVSVADGVLADFRREQPVIVARAVARAAAKYAISRSAEKKVGEKNEALGDVLGAIANIAGAVTEQADTRSWHLLPGSISVLRLRLEPGAHELFIDGALALRFNVATGRPTVLSRRVWN